MIYRSDRLFQCFRHSDTTTNLDEARKQGQGVRFGGDESAPRCPLGVPPNYNG